MYLNTYTGIPIFEFSFSITLQNISVEVESTVAIVNHSLQKEILHMGKVFVLRSKNTKVNLVSVPKKAQTTVMS